ncbi:MAG: hypothetical protein RLZZ584_3268, partial [Pseudomonadota bacterium]
MSNPAHFPPVRPPGGADLQTTGRAPDPASHAARQRVADEDMVMKIQKTALSLAPRAWARWLAVGLTTAVLSSCGGGGGGNAGGADTPPVEVPVSGIATGPAGLRASSALTITVTAVRMGGKPSVDFT